MQHFRENLRKVTICRTMGASGDEFGPGNAFSGYNIEYEMDYNITDINVRITLEHPAGDEISGKLSFTPDGSSSTSNFPLFDLGNPGDGINATKFNSVEFDDDT